MSGYDYQFVWSARRALETIRPGSEVTQIVIEGLREEDEIDLGSGRESFLGIDLAEYYGGDSFHSVRRLVLAQLKYSLSHPERHWTITRLSRAKQRKPESSVVGRLSACFADLLTHASAAEVLGKVSVQLVTNCPIQAQAAAILRKAQSELRKSRTEPEHLGIRDLRGSGLSESEYREIKRLFEASRLESNAFALFLLCLDLSGFGQPPLETQRSGLFADASGFDVVAASESVLRLLRLIRERAQNGDRTPITKHAVYSCLETTEREFLPAPCLIEVPRPRIGTQDHQRLAEALLAGSSRKILVHGIAGVGKSVALTSLGPKLPPGSILVVYDCYARGQTESPGKERFPDEVALTQISNEVALCAGIDCYQFRNKGDRRARWNRFEEVLRRASERVSKAGAMVVVAIDAADIAVRDSKRAAGLPRQCFVLDIWKLLLPQNARLILSCRTHRRPLLQAPADVDEVKLAGFSKADSGELLRSRFRCAQPEHCQRFHDATQGVPRLQFYWLAELTKQTAAAALEQIAAGQTCGLEELYRDWIDASGDILDQRTTVEQVLAVLMSQARPVDSGVLGGVLGLAAGVATSFCQSLAPGLESVDNDLFLFRDEDFETYLDQRLTENAKRTAHGRLADYCMSRLRDGGYGTKHAARHLFAAQRHGGVIALTVDQTGTDALTEAPEQGRCAKERCVLGLRSSLREHDGTGACKVLFRLVEAESRHNIGSALLRDHPDVGIALGKHESVREAYGAVEWSAHQGNYRFDLAAALGRHSLQEEAVEQLRRSNAALNTEIAQARAREHGESVVRISDISQFAEAAFWIKGPVSAEQVIRGWKPARARLAALRQLFQSLRLKLGSQQLVRAYEACPALSLVRAAALAGLWRPGLRWHCRDVKVVLDKVLSCLANHPASADALEPVLLDLAETCAASGVDEGQLRRLLDHIPRRPKSATSIFSRAIWYDYWHDAIRGAVLGALISGKELSADDLLPAHREGQEGPEKNHGSDRQQEKLKATLASLLPAYRLRADAFLRGRHVSTVGRRLRETIEAKMQRVSDTWYRGDETFEVLVDVAIDAILAARGCDQSLVEELAESVQSILRQTPLYVWARMVERLCQDERYWLASEDIIRRCRDRLAEEPLRASEKAGLLMRLARAALQRNKELSRELYDAAMQNAAGLDDHTCWLLRALTDIARRAADIDDAARRRHLASDLAEAAAVCSPLAEESEAMPWEQLNTAVAQLDCETGLVSTLKWHAQGLAPLPHLIGPLVTGLSRGGQLSPVLVLPLIELGHRHWAYESDAVAILDRLWETGARGERQAALKLFDYIAQHVERDLPYGSRSQAACVLLDWCSAKGIRRDAVDRLVEIRDFYARLQESERDDQAPFPGSRIDATKELRRLQKRARRSPRKFIQDLPQVVQGAGVAFGTKEVSELLTDLAFRLDAAGRAQLAGKLTAWPSDDYRFRPAVAEALAWMLSRWHGSRWAQSLALKELRSYLASHLPGLLRWQEESCCPVEKLLSSPALQRAQRGEVLIPAILDGLAELGPRELCNALVVLARGLKPLEATEVAEWALAQLLPPEVPTAEGPREADDEKEALARFLYGLFAQPDNRLRWEALYAARQMLSLEAEPLLRHLVELSHGCKDTLWMSARVWLLFLFHHLACATPKMLLDHAGRIAAHALNEDFPHAGIQELSKRIALRLAELAPAVLPGDQMDRLRAVNEPRSCLWPKAEPLGGFGGKPRREWSSWRFHFSHMDTLPYWYAPLGHCFGLHRCDVAARAERWICDKWGYTNADCMDERSSIPDREHNWQLYHNDHGSIPVMEELQTYLEWHAMHMAAGEMIRELPIAVGSEDTRTWGWHAWLRSNSFDADPWITSDLRGPAPARPYLHGVLGELDDWLDPAAKEHEKEVLSEAGWLIADAYITAHGRDRFFHVYVSSALVSPETAMALARGLAAAEHPTWYGLPRWKVSYEQNVDELEDCLAELVASPYRPEQEIEIDGFLLKPWNVHVHSERKMHTTDSRWPGLGRGWAIPGQAFVDAVRVTRHRLESLEYAAASHGVAAKVEVWDDAYLARYNDDIWSTGYRLLLKKEAILHFLQQMAKDLVVKVDVLRSKKEATGGSWEGFDVERTRCFVLRRSGRIDRVG